MKVGKRFKIARVLKDWTILELSQRTRPSVSTSQISLFERDLIKLTHAEKKALAIALGLPGGNDMISSEKLKEFLTDPEYGWEVLNQKTRTFGTS